MKIAVLFGTIWCLHAASAEVHSYKSFYTGTTGINDFPDVVAINYLDDEVMAYFDSKTKRYEPKQSWITEKLGQDYVKQEEGIRMNAAQWFPPNLQIVMDRFNQTGGIHTFQHMYGCEWDEETDRKSGFRQYGYDGKDFLAYDMSTPNWVAPVPQAEATVRKWNADSIELQRWNDYVTRGCVEWLQKYVKYGKEALKVSRPVGTLLQKSSYGVACHATGFYPDAVMIIWKKNGVEVDDDVDVGETLPNEDGTFQKRAVLTVSPEERKKAQYSCEVTHKSGEPIVMVFEEANNLPAIIGGCIVGAALIALIAGIVVVVVKKNKQKKNDYHEASQSDGSSRNSAELPKA